MGPELTPHDESFRKVFGDPDLARPLIEHYLPISVVDQLDLTVLSVDSETFVDDKLKGRQGDVLFRTRFKEGGDALVYVLLEHKSSPDRWVALQLTKYIIRIWYRELDRNQGLRKLPTILPVVFYHGKRDWQAPLNLADLVECPEGYKRYVPDFDYELLNCAAIPDERLEGDQPLGGVVMVYKHAFDEDFGQHLDRWLKLLQGLVRAKTVGEQVFALLKYIGHLCDNVGGEEFRQRVMEAYEEKGEEIMSTVADQWIERGKEIGREEGEHKGKRDAVLGVIEERFDQVPTAVTDLVSEVTDGEKLDAMLSAAARAQTVEQLGRMLREARESE
jgi:predicted transposase/invertase (TIGR01784 family)